MRTRKFRIVTDLVVRCVALHVGNDELCPLILRKGARPVLDFVQCINPGDFKLGVLLLVLRLKFTEEAAVLSEASFHNSDQSLQARTGVFVLRGLFGHALRHSRKWCFDDKIGVGKCLRRVEAEDISRGG